MKVTFNTSDLIGALEKVQRAAQTKVTSNTNNGFFIACDGEKAEFQANDYSIGISTFCEASIEEKGIVVISAPQLLSTIKMMPSGPVVMEQKKGETTVYFKAGRYTAKFPTRENDDFPTVSEIDHAYHADVRCKDLMELVNQVSFATSTDSKNPLFTGVLCEIKENTFTMVGTNSHRLAVKEITLDKPAAGTGRFICPSYVLLELIRMLPQDDEATVEISWASKHVAFSFGETYFVSNLINGEYPDYKRVFPENFDLHATLDLKEFEEAVRFVSPISRDMSYKTINFEFGEGQLKAYEEDPEIGRSETTIPAELDGDDVKITFNCIYIEDIIKHSKGNKIYLHIKKSGPMLVEQEEDKAYRYVVTPMRGR